MSDYDCKDVVQRDASFFVEAGSSKLGTVTPDVEHALKQEMDFSVARSILFICIREFFFNLIRDVDLVAPWAAICPQRLIWRCRSIRLAEGVAVVSV